MLFISTIVNILLSFTNEQNSYEQYQKAALNKIYHEREYKSFLLLFFSLAFLFIIFMIWKKKEKNSSKQASLDDSFTTEGYDLIRDLQPKPKQV